MTVSWRRSVGLLGTIVPILELLDFGCGTITP
jgi:hypothetical protein